MKINISTMQSFDITPESDTMKKHKMSNNKITIFDEQISRKPNRYPWTKAFIESMWDGFWTRRKIKFGSDVHQFKVELTEQEREIIVRTLSTIGQIEIAVKTFWGKLGDNLPHPSLQELGYVMANVEVIHNDAYEHLLSELDLEKEFDKNLELDWIQGRVNYLKKYNHKYYKDSKKQFLYALILFTLFVENVSLFSQFYIIDWFKTNKNYLKATAQQVKYTKNEETIHALIGIKIINTIREELPELFDEDLEKKILHEAEQAFMAESKIVDWMINGIDEPRLSAPILKEFIKNRINESLMQIKFPKVFDVDEKLIEQTEWFEEQVMGNVMTDFFDSHDTGYSRDNKTFEEDDLF